MCLFKKFPVELHGVHLIGYGSVVPKVGGTAPLGAVRNSRGAVKQKWAVGGRYETHLIIIFPRTY